MSSALLLAAGKATRLGEIREKYAKACVPVAGTTPLQFLIHRLSMAGVDELWINLHWQKAQVKEHALRHAPPGMRLHFLEEEPLLGTGGTLLQCSKVRGSLPDLVLNAKMFTDVDFAEVLALPVGTLVLHPASPLHVFGGLSYNAENRVTGLFSLAEAQALSSKKPSITLAEESTAPVQKSTNHLTPQAAVFTGITRPHPEWLQHLKESIASQTQPPHCLLRHGVFPAMKAGILPTAYFHSGWWCEISTPQRMQAAEKMVKETLGNSDRQGRMKQSFS